jgi:branched-chain amino acid transport system substrate-binding protein
VVSIDGYQADNTDFRTTLTRIQSERPDALYVAGYFMDTAAIVRQARELGLRVQMFGTTAIEDNQFLQLAGNSAEGLIYPLATGFDASSEAPRVREFVQAFRSRYNHDPGWVEAQAYDAFMLVCKAVGEINGEVTGAALKTALDSMGPFEGVAGTVRFDANGDVVKPVVFRIVRDGRFSPIGPSE